MQDWTVIYELSAIPTIFVLLRILKSKATESSASRNYYTATLFLVLVWTSLAFISANLPLDQEALSAFITELTFFVVSIVVYVFVTSSIYFTRHPRLFETVFVASPIIMILIAFIVDPFSEAYTEFGWYGDFAYPTVKYAWLTLAILVMVYSYVRLFGIRSRLQDREAKRRMTYFASSNVLALVVAVGLYLLSQAMVIPVFSSIGVNLSVLLAYPAFSPINPNPTG